MRAQYLLGLAFVAALAATGGVANASSFVVDDRAEDPAPIGVFANDFEFGLTINGNLFQQGLNNPASGTSPGESLTFDGRWIDLGQSIPLVRTVYFVEPGTPNVVSDILQYTVQASSGGFGHIFGTFTSDGDPGSLGTVPGGTLPGDIWLEGSGDFIYQAPFFTGVVQTAPGDVPEPASMLMLIVGAAALRRRPSPFLPPRVKLQ